MGDLASFAKNMRTFADNVAHNIDVIVKKVAFEVVSSLIDDTPIDEGTAKSNYRVSVGRVTTKVIQALAPGMRGSTRVETIEAATREAFRKIAQAKPGNTIFIVNNVDYVLELNAGTSSQHPGGFVEKSIIRGSRKAKQFRILGRRLRL